MSWSVRTCVDCGEYRYVEDGVCRDCRTEVTEQSMDFEEIIKIVRQDSTNVVSCSNAAGVGKVSKLHHYLKLQKKYRSAVRSSVQRAKRIITEGDVLFEEFPDAPNEKYVVTVTETHPKEDYFEAVNVHTRQTRRFAYDVFTAGNMELVRKDEGSQFINADEVADKLESEEARDEDEQ